MPGQTLQIKNHIVYLNGKANKEPDNVQYTYKMKLKSEFPIDLADELGITNEDLLMYNQSGVIPLTKKAYICLLYTSCKPSGSNHSPDSAPH